MQIRELLQDAEQLKAEIITDRRTLHQNPEAGPRLPETAARISSKPSIFPTESVRHCVYRRK